MDNKELDNKRHTLAHLLAAAVLSFDEWKDAQLAIGPTIENGFYYDIKFTTPPSEKDLARIEKRMKKILPNWKKMERKEWQNGADAVSVFPNNPFKTEIINDIVAEKGLITTYKAGSFEDVCRGGHSENPATEIDQESFKLSKLAGAYWRGDEKNPQLTRIYGLAFNTKEELEAYVKMQEEAEKRDHRKLGAEMDLFTFSPLVGSGLPMFTPRGALMRQLIVDFVWELMQKHGYERVWSPHMANVDLYKTSGHYDKFADDIFYIKSKKTETQFIMKPMNCPHHTQIYASRPRSYRDLPLRFSEVATVYRDENTGQLAGLTRVRSISQDDAHIFCRMDQVKAEVKGIYDIVTRFYEALGMPLRIRLSTNDPAHPEKYLGSKENWAASIASFEEILKELGKEYEVGVGEAAFYGPKIDFIAKDAIGREWQLATAQIDFNQPERFELEYTDAEGKKQRPVMVHRAISGSLERFMGIIIEHYAGHFPLWLAPVQARVLAISDKFQDYGAEVLRQLKAAGMRAELADSNETLGKRIRAAQTEKIPYILVVGEDEMQANTVAVRHSTKGDMKTMPISELLSLMRKEVSEKTT